MDLDEAPVITRGWWVAGHVILVPPIRGLLRLTVRGGENIPSHGAVPPWNFLTKSFPGVT